MKLGRNTDAGFKTGWTLSCWQIECCWPWVICDARNGSVTTECPTPGVTEARAWGLTLLACISLDPQLPEQHQTPHQDDIYQLILFNDLKVYEAWSFPAALGRAELGPLWISLLFAFLCNDMSNSSLCKNLTGQCWLCRLDNLAPVSSVGTLAGDTAGVLPSTWSCHGVGRAMPPLTAPLGLFSPAAAAGDAKNTPEQGSGGWALDFSEVYWYFCLVTPAQATWCAARNRAPISPFGGGQSQIMDNNCLLFLF